VWVDPAVLFCVLSARKSFFISRNFSPEKNGGFTDRVHESNHSVFLLCVQFTLTVPQELAMIRDCFEA
jgi:hypothetical protein